MFEMTRKARSKKRTSGLGSIVERDGRFYLRISINGKIIQRGIFDPSSGLRAETRTQAERLASVMATDLRSGGKLGLYDQTHEENARVTISEINEKYLEAFGPRWNRLRRSNWDHFMEAASESFTFADEVDHASLGRHAQRRLSTPKERGGGQRSPAAVNRELAALKRLFTWGYQVGMIEKNPFSGFSLLKEPKSRDRILSHEEIARLLSALDDPAFSHIRLIVRVAITTGMRRSEILGLKWAGPGAGNHENIVDLRRGYFFLQKTKSRPRQIPIPEIIKKELTEHAAAAAGSLYSCYVFPSPADPSKPIGEIKKSFASLLKKAGIQGVKFHDLRHCAASEWVAAGIDIHAVKELLGHASITTTERYLTSRSESKMTAMDITGKILSLSGGGSEGTAKPDGKTVGKRGARRPKSSRESDK